MKQSRNVVVENEAGLHARPSDLIARTALRFQSRITLARGPERVDARSILGILTLGAAQGTPLVIEAEGPDAEAALTALVQLFDSHFADPHENDTSVDL